MRFLKWNRCRDGYDCVCVCVRTLTTHPLGLLKVFHPLCDAKNRVTPTGFRQNHKPRSHFYQVAWGKPCKYSEFQFPHPKLDLALRGCCEDQELMYMTNRTHRTCRDSSQVWGCLFRVGCRLAPRAGLVNASGSWRAGKSPAVPAMASPPAPRVLYTPGQNLPALLLKLPGMLAAAGKLK